MVVGYLVGNSRVPPTVAAKFVQSHDCGVNGKSFGRENDAVSV
jgi:hypothetical protein